MSWLRAMWAGIKRTPGWLLAVLVLLALAAVYWMREAGRRSRLSELDRQRVRIEQRTSTAMADTRDEEAAHRALILSQRSDRIRLLDAERDRIEAAGQGDREAFDDEWARVFGRR